MHVRRCGWSQAGDGGAAGSVAQLVVLDSGEPEQQKRCRELVARRSADWVFLCSAEAMDNEDIRSMLGCYAHAYQRLPGNVPKLDIILQQIQSMAALRAAVTATRSPDAAADDGAEDEMVGTSQTMLDTFKSIRKLATVDAPVLIRGESGTGKELAAQAIHERSARAEGPLVTVNCAALPAELVQSELFGHNKGAFTGAVRNHIGYVEAADGGTLLLDEVGDLPLSLQVHLLRFLQSGTFQRVGSNQEIAVNVRVLAATHVPLEQAITDGAFREDLYHRLNVVSLQIPSLRERIEDIEVLAWFFFERFAAERAPHIHGISRQALQTMCRYNWPGNVRELMNRLRRALVMSEGRLISVADLGLGGIGESKREALTLEAARARADQDQIQTALSRNGQHMASTARELGVSRVTLYRMMEKYRIQRVGALVMARICCCPHATESPVLCFQVHRHHHERRAARMQALLQPECVH